MPKHIHQIPGHGDSCFQVLLRGDEAKNALSTDSRTTGKGCPSRLVVVLQATSPRIRNRSVFSFSYHWLRQFCRIEILYPPGYPVTTAVLWTPIKETLCSSLSIRYTASIYYYYYYYYCESDSSVGVATDCGLGGPGSNRGGNEIFRPARPALGPIQSLVKWVPGSFPGVKCGRGVLLTTHTLLVPRS